MPVRASHDGIHQPHHGSLLGARAWRRRTEPASDVVSEAPHSLITSGKNEAIIKYIFTLRVQAYGYRDDEYFFLKLIDMSRH